MKILHKITPIMAGLMAVIGSACHTSAQAEPSLAVLKNSIPLEGVNCKPVTN